MTVPSSESSTRLSAHNKLQCTECGSSNLIRDVTRGELICNNCGLVNTEHIIDEGPEWRAFDTAEQNKRSRVGSPTTVTIHDKGLSTVIDWRDKDAFGKKLDPKRRAQIYRLRKWQVRSRVHSSMDRNLAFAMSELDRLVSQIGIPTGVKETSAVLYRKTVDKKLNRGRSIEAMVAASIYAACRIRKVPRTLDEISNQSRITRKELGRCYRLLLREIDAHIPVADPIDFIPRFCADLSLSGQAMRKAIRIVKMAQAEHITAGKDPTGLAAASIYIAGVTEGERRTQREIAEAAKVTEVTVRNRYKELVKRLAISIQL